MIVAVDYDNTYTADPVTFDAIIKAFQVAGHTVICVTGRSEDMGESVLASIGQTIPVVFAGKEWKRDAAKAQGYDVNVWIDDCPEMIGRNLLLGNHG